MAAPPDTALRETLKWMEDKNEMNAPYDHEESWTIQSVLANARTQHNGAKLTFLQAVLVYFLCYFVLNVVLTYTVTVIASPTANALLMENLPGIVLSLLLSPLGYGIGLLGIRKSAGLEIDYNMIVEPYRYFLPLLMLATLVSLITLMGFALLILPGIYFALSYSFAPYLLMAKKMGIWESMETSRKAVTKNFWRFFGLSLILAIVNIVGALLLLIPLFWLIPISVIAFGEVYNHTFRDVENSEATTAEVNR